MIIHGKPEDIGSWLPARSEHQKSSDLACCACRSEEPIHYSILIFVGELLLFQDSMLAWNTPETTADTVNLLVWFSPESGLYQGSRWDLRPCCWVRSLESLARNMGQGPNAPRHCLVLKGSFGNFFMDLDGIETCRNQHLWMVCFAAHSQQSWRGPKAKTTCRRRPSCGPKSQ